MTSGAGSGTGAAESKKANARDRFSPGTVRLGMTGTLRPPTYPIPAMSRLALLLALLLPLAACDSAGPEDPPGPADASIAIALGAVTANANCDSSTNPGDFQFQLDVSDLGNNTIESITLPSTATYGVWSAPTLISLFSGDQASVGRTVSIQQPRTEGSGFAVSLSGMEWDSQTARDGNFDDRTSTRTHRFASGQFSNVVGTQRLTIGNSACNVTLDYVVTVQ